VLRIAVGELSRIIETVPFVIGREADCDLVLEDPRVSRHHVQLEVLDDGRVVLRDLGSANGTFVDERRIEGGVWFDVPGSFRVGRTVLHVEPGDTGDRTIAALVESGATVAVDAPVAGADRGVLPASPPVAPHAPVGPRPVAETPFVPPAAPAIAAHSPERGAEVAGGTARPAGTVRSAATRAIASQLTLGFSLVAAIVTLIVFVRGIGLIDGLDAGTVSNAEILSFESQGAQASGLILLSTLLSAIAFLAWLSRSVENAPLLGLGTPPVSPRWAIGWWFVPFLSFWKPFGVVRDLYVRLGGAAAPVGLVTAWWIAWIAGLVLDRLSGAMVDRASTLDAIRSVFVLGIVAELSLAVAAILAILLVRRMQGWADAHAAQAGSAGRSAAMAG
jgi:hypothetical protein